MGMERVISMGERLQRLLDDTEKEAEAMVADAERRAGEMISRAREDSERRRTMAQRGYGIEELLNEAEEKAKKDAAKNIKDYEKKAEAVKEIPKERMEEAVAFVLREVLPE